ncbi:uncharacterized protein F5891DRAFT_535877 [Suillus fuscotomentosus]|uniref:Uncharacterized protein n=1 Tax=Suillus fuscotomentosus TaxID=1912939 RepID=A0AAD4E180_9AGAM|nr:uncharacterized protein F5891DRAFT_535877 [Suillus fuscotomentosus]KAG1897376.1 hypothetical protein F5891DRAFT_535877 [Suillus fuscotomentosus]
MEGESSTSPKLSSHAMPIDRRAADNMVVLLDGWLDNQREGKPKKIHRSQDHSEFRTNLMLVQTAYSTVAVVNSHECALVLVYSKFLDVHTGRDLANILVFLAIQTDVNDNERLVNLAMKVVKELTYAIAQNSFGDAWKSRALEKDNTREFRGGNG